VKDSQAGCKTIKNQSINPVSNFTHFYLVTATRLFQYFIRSCISCQLAAAISSLSAFFLLGFGKL
jgi:hypothetical protein